MKPLNERLTDRELIQRGDLTLAFRARDSVLERPVFVKALNPALAADQEIRARFEREAKAVARLDHPNLVRIYEYGEDPQEGLYMLLEWVDGSTLTEYMRSVKCCDAASLKDLAGQLLAGLAALHSVGILHRDLKPDNILVCRPPEGGGHCFKITDFSLAALRDAPRLTHHEAIVGTPAYMAPEQAAGGMPSEQSDLFALGLILYEAATGVNPFAAPSMLETLQRLRELDPDFTRPEILALPEQMQELLKRLLQKDVSERFESANAARRLIGEREQAAEPASPPRARPIQGRRYAILGLLLLGMWAGKTWLFKDSKVFDYVILLAVVAGLIIARKPGKSANPNALRPRDRKRDLKYLGLALAVVTFWGGMMLWYPWDKDKSSSPPPVSTQPTTDAAVKNSVPATTTTTSAEPSLTSPSEPEFRSPPEAVPTGTDSPARARTAAMPVDTMASDSVDLVLTTEPWAYVSWNGSQIGATPLGRALRLPRGSQSLLLRNPAFPPIDIQIDLHDKNQRMNVRLSDYAALVRVTVEPWGELYMDDEHMGTTPLTKPLFVAPGTHTLRVSHPQLKSVQKSFQAAGGDTLAFRVDLTHEEASIDPQRKEMH